jgi:hypothetical protein
MKFSTSRSWLLLAAPLGAVAVFSCTVVSGAGMTTGGTSGDQSTSTGVGGGGTGAGGSLPQGATGKEIFASFQADILGECGACHKLGGVADAPFLALPDVYSSIVTWPGIITLTPTSSILLTHPGAASHGAGMAPDMSKSLRAKVLPWLQKEALDIPKPTETTKPYITPFKPLLKGAFNTVYLDPLGKTLESASISFNAIELGSPPSMLLLKNVEVHPVADTTIHLVHPIFSVYPAGGGEEPDPIDSLSNVDQTMDLNDDPMLGTGTVILTNWQKDGRIGLAFETAEVTGVGTPLDGCKDDASKALFAKDVIPQLQYCADTCHAGKQAKPTAAMSLENLMMMPVDEVCARVRARIHPGDPDTSDILVVTDPSKQVAHGYKFAGNKGNYSAFKTAVSPWINSEK